ncbi:M28 family metallopeptidase [Leptobacterium sp. I13]|uniref:M28 family metallopeptidase n=1 Tax=Leptobacterium meishanense TaxID=3128904 RepID=UPI0030ECDEC0
MKKTIFFILIGLLSCKSSTVMMRPEGIIDKPDAGNNVEKAIDKKAYYSTETSVKKAMEFLASDKLRGREAGSEGIAKAADYAETIFIKNGLKPYFSTYRDTLSNYEKVAYNVVGYVEGNDPSLKNEFIIIGAHYDHIGLGERVNGDAIANGANDNASGSTAVLELARYFGNVKTNKRSLLFILFSAEEKGLLGSKHLAEKLKQQSLDLYTVFNIEMIGVSMKGRGYKAYITGYEKSNMAAKINEYVGEDLIGYLPTAKEYQLFKRSDNYPFYEVFKVPAQTISTFDFTNYDYYHHVDDETSEMDFAHMATLINGMIPAIERMSNTPTREITMNE